MSKPVQPVPPMPMMNRQQSSMFTAGGGINNGMMSEMMGDVPGIQGMQTNGAGGSTWSDVKGKLRV